MDLLLGHSATVPSRTAMPMAVSNPTTTRAAVGGPAEPGRRGRARARVRVRDSPQQASHLRPRAGSGARSHRSRMCAGNKRGGRGGASRTKNAARRTPPIVWITRKFCGSIVTASGFPVEIHSPMTDHGLHTAEAAMSAEGRGESWLVVAGEQGGVSPATFT